MISIQEGCMNSSQEVVSINVKGEDITLALDEPSAKEFAYFLRLLGGENDKKLAKIILDRFVL